MKLPRDVEAAVLATPGVEVRGTGGARKPRGQVPLVAPALALEIVVPYRVVSEANQWDGWQARCRRNRAAGDAWRAALAVHHAFAVRLRPPLAVTLTRLGGRRLDDDNLAGAFKALRDAIADWLGLDDGDPRLAWRYGQEPGGPAGVRVRVEELTGVRP